MNKHIKLAWLLILLLWAIMLPVPLVLGFWYMETPAIAYTTRKVVTLNVPVGGSLRVHVDSELTTDDCEAWIYRSIVDSKGLILEYAPQPRPLSNSYEVELPLSTTLSEGPAAYRARIAWQCNPLQAIWPKVIFQRPLPFTITPAPTDGSLPMQQGAYKRSLPVVTLYEGIQ